MEIEHRNKSSLEGLKNITSIIAFIVGIFTGGLAVSPYRGDSKTD